MKREERPADNEDWKFPKRHAEFFAVTTKRKTQKYNQLKLWNRLRSMLWLTWSGRCASLGHGWEIGRRPRLNSWKMIKAMTSIMRNRYYHQDCHNMWAWSFLIWEGKAIFLGGRTHLATSIQACSFGATFDDFNAISYLPHTLNFMN